MSISQHAPDDGMMALAGAALNDRAVERVYGDVDKDFNKVGRCPVKFSVARGQDIGWTGRALVAAKCLAPDDIRAVTMQADLGPMMQQMTEKGADTVARDTLEGYRSAMSGRGATGALVNAVQRGLKTASFSQRDMSNAFGRLAQEAQSCGRVDVAKSVGLVSAALAQREISDQRSRSAQVARPGEER